MGEKIELVKKFLVSKETKETAIGHTILAVIVGISYLGFGMVGAFVSTAIGGLLELSSFHTLWMYRDNKDKEHPVLFSLVATIINWIIVFIIVALVVVIAIGIYRVTGFNPFYTLGIFAFLALLYMPIKTYLVVKG